jgi:hypothetical protein
MVVKLFSHHFYFMMYVAVKNGLDYFKYKIFAFNRFLRGKIPGLFDLEKPLFEIF